MMYFETEWHLKELEMAMFDRKCFFRMFFDSYLYLVEPRSKIKYREVRPLPN